MIYQSDACQDNSIEAARAASEFSSEELPDGLTKTFQGNTPVMVGEIVGLL